MHMAIKHSNVLSSDLAWAYYSLCTGLDIAEFTFKLTHLYLYSLLGIPSTGNAALDPQSYTATISIRGSDHPHGTFWFSEVSQKAAAEETTGTLEVFISRKFGSIGEVRVYFEIIPG